MEPSRSIVSTEQTTNKARNFHAAMAKLAVLPNSWGRTAKEGFFHCKEGVGEMQGERVLEGSRGNDIAGKKVEQVLNT